MPAHNDAAAVDKLPVADKRPIPQTIRAHRFPDSVDTACPCNMPLSLLQCQQMVQAAGYFHDLIVF